MVESLVGSLVWLAVIFRLVVRQSNRSTYISSPCLQNIDLSPNTFESQLSAAYICEGGNT